MIFVFVLGMIFGAGLLMAYGVFKMKKAKSALIDQLRIKAQEMDQKEKSITDRLIKASDLAQAQMALRAQMEMPSKNALHSKYKNGLISELQDMEQQKLDLLRTVLAEGFDPTIAVIDGAGVKQDVLLSTYVNEAAVQLNESLGDQAPMPPTDPTQARKVGKFLVYKGGKDDGTTH
jgi:hypothetical protein